MEPELLNHEEGDRWQIPPAFPPRGALGERASSALKALSAPAGGSQFVCSPAQVPSVCGIACAVDEHGGKGLLGWER